jgi:hypothetical protein
VRKLRKFICKVCGKEFESRQEAPNTCSKECKAHFMGQEKWKPVIIQCKECGKEIKTKQSESGKLQKEFCSKSCGSSYGQKGRVLSEETRQRISNTLTGVSLKERGFSKESILKCKNALREKGQEWVQFQKGKTFDEIYGEEKAQKIKNRFTPKKQGQKNPMSIQSIMKRYNCSEDEASLLTPAYGRIGNKHPMFGIKLTEEERKKCLSKEHSWFSCGKFNGIFWQATFELEFLVNCYENNINVKRYDLNGIKYFFENKEHYTYPDFIINDMYIIEVKGIKRLKDLARIKACQEYFGDKFIVIDRIKKRNSLTTLHWIDKQVKKYGNLIELIYIPKRYYKTQSELANKLLPKEVKDGNRI